MATLPFHICFILVFWHIASSPIRHQCFYSIIQRITGFKFAFLFAHAMQEPVMSCTACHIETIDNIIATFCRMNQNKSPAIGSG